MELLLPIADITAYLENIYCYFSSFFIFPAIIEFFYRIHNMNEYISINNDVLMIGRNKIHRHDINSIKFNDNDKNVIEIHYKNKIHTIRKIEIKEDPVILMDKIVRWHVSTFSKIHGYNNYYKKLSSWYFCGIYHYPVVN